VAERILVVDDEPGVRSALRGILADEGFEVLTADSGEAAVAMAERESFDAALLDVWLPGIDGLETLKRLRDRRPDAEVVMISGHGTIDTAVRATKLGAFDFVEKPLSLERTLLVLRNALRQRRLEQRNRRLLDHLARETEIVGRSMAAEGLRRAVDAAAACDAPVLLCGEPDSGRQTAARRIHAAGRAADGPFVDVPCATLDRVAAEQALLGPSSRLQTAAGGSLLLEDLDRLAPDLQRHLAGRLGSGSDVEPFRILATAGPAGSGLDAALRRRIDVLRIDVPALRERREDVPLLAERFMSDLAREYSRLPKRLGADCLVALKAHGWPGNVRELRGAVERLLLVVAGDVVHLEDLPASLGGGRPPGEDLYREFASLEEGLKAFERHYVARVLSEEGADLDAAARRLGLTRQELERRREARG
jgi:two-component system nitrogen regulation response regulator NtrX